MREVAIVGVGPGAEELLTLACARAAQEADVAVGSARALGVLPLAKGARICEAVRAADIVAFLSGDGEWERAVIAMSGDVGFFSGAARVREALLARFGDELAVRVLAGVGSVAYFSAALGRPWQDWRFASAHGEVCDIVAEARRGGVLFLVTSGPSCPSDLCAKLARAGFGCVPVAVGERLSYDDERITRLRADEVVGRSFDALNVMLVDFEASGSAACAPARWLYATGGIPDELFIRADVPMTKQEVRAVALSKLRVAPGDAVWDVGAGTGSVSVEAASCAPGVSVWAVERNERAIRLIEENAKVFGCAGVHAVHGAAPAALAGLPAPDAVFVGGAGGALSGILDAALAANPRVRICVTCIALESLARATDLLSDARFADFEACQVSVSRAEAAGPYHLMKAQNPIFILSARGTGASDAADEGAPVLRPSSEGDGGRR